MKTYVDFDYIMEYLRKTQFLENGVVPYIAVKDMLQNSPKIDVEMIQAKRSISSDMFYAKDKDFIDYLYGSLVNDISQEIWNNHNEFVGKAESENTPYPIVKEYYIKMMFAKPHDIVLSRELIEMLNKEVEWEDD